MTRPRTYRGRVVADEKSIAYHQRRIGEVQGHIETYLALLDMRVTAARFAGVSWYKIGDAIGISRQAATERFERLPELNGSEP